MREEDLLLISGFFTVILALLIFWAFTGFKLPDLSAGSLRDIEPSAGHWEPAPMPDQHYTTDDGAL